MVTPPLDLDEIARAIKHDDDLGLLYSTVEITKMRALVAAARGKDKAMTHPYTFLDLDVLEKRLLWAKITLSPDELAELLRLARVPEMPADVAGTIKRMRGRVAAQYQIFASSMDGEPNERKLVETTTPDPDCAEAATLIESLERGRQEAGEGQGVMFKHLNDLCTTHRERAEQAERERDEARGDLDKESAEAEASFTRLIEERDRRETALRGRLATLEAVERKARLYAKYPIPGRLRELNDALAALDRKEPKT